MSAAPTMATASRGGIETRRPDATGCRSCPARDGNWGTVSVARRQLSFAQLSSPPRTFGRSRGTL